MQDDELLQSSVAVHVTMVSPNGKTAGASFITSGATSQISEVVGLPRSTGVPSALVCSAVRSSGQVISGSRLSIILTVAEQLSDCPKLSVTVKKALQSIRHPGDESTVTNGVTLV